MRVWIVTQYYPPETGAPSTRLSGLAKQWQAQGVNVTVLTGIPNHPDGIIHPDYADRPAFYAEDMNGVPVWRHWLYVTANKGRVKRVLNMVSFAASVLVGHRKMMKAAGGHKPDVIVASSPSFFCVFSAWMMARRYKTKFVFEVRDLWPAIFLQMGILKPGFIFNVLSKMEMFLYRRADAVVTVTRAFAKDIVRRGVDPQKLWVVFNGVSDTDFMAAHNARKDGSVDKLRAQLGMSPLTKIVLYIGNHGEAQALGQIVDAARLMIKRTDVVFLFVGGGAEKEKLVEYAKGVPNVRFLPSVKHAETWAYYAMADVNLVCLKNIPDFEMFIPSKMFEIMAAESAAVACLTGEGAQIMQESGCALVVPSEASDRLAEALNVLLDDPERRAEMAEAGRRFVQQHFLHSSLAARYTGLFTKLLGGQAGILPEKGLDMPQDEADAA